ncbi:hypothetical protein C5472_04310 [Photorhabdus sp. RW14-46]|nr:hypothetical protein [Photorhabdus sp. RW14-46]
MLHITNPIIKYINLEDDVYFYILLILNLYIFNSLQLTNKLLHLNGLLVILEKLFLIVVFSLICQMFLLCSSEMS